MRIQSPVPIRDAEVSADWLPIAGDRSRALCPALFPPTFPLWWLQCRLPAPKPSTAGLRESSWQVSASGWERVSHCPLAYTSPTFSIRQDGGKWWCWKRGLGILGSKALWEIESRQSTLFHLNWAPGMSFLLLIITEAAGNWAPRRLCVYFWQKAFVFYLRPTVAVSFHSARLSVTAS